MADSFSKQLEDLLNPLPKFEDPEDDQDETTKAKVIEKFTEDDDEDEVAFSGLRKQITSELLETDARYIGKAVSRKQLLMEMDESGEDDDGDEDRDDEEEDDDDDADALEDIEISSDDDEEIGSDDEDENSLENDIGKIKTSVSKMKVDDFTFSQKLDFHKLTEGMDDLGDSEENEGGDESEENESDDEGEQSDGNEGSNDEIEDDEQDEVTVMTFSKEKVDEEVEKGKAVKDQLALWDQLLEGRIKIQKALMTANQLPQPQTFPEFKKRGEAEFAGALKNSHKALKALQRSLLELQDQLLFQNPGTRPISLGKIWGAASCDEENEVISDEEEEMKETGQSEGESGPPKRKLDMAEYPDFMAKRFSAFQPYRNATLQKWHDKTRLTMGKSVKGFGAFDRNILTQVEQVLMDNDRLLRRTQTRRSEYRVLGKAEALALTSLTVTAEGKEVERVLKANTHLNDLDEDIFDDDDFYHQLLRELIERKTSAADPNDQVAMGKQWLTIQKLRSKIKKRVDTKASKGRKVRFHIHSKLVNFMAPIDHSSLNDEARTELYRSLFGKNSVPQELPVV